MSRQLDSAAATATAAAAAAATATTAAAAAAAAAANRKLNLTEGERLSLLGLSSSKRGLKQTTPLRGFRV